MDKRQLVVDDILKNIHKYKSIGEASRELHKKLPHEFKTFEGARSYLRRHKKKVLGDDFIHINEYLDFVSDMQDVFYFQEGDICNDDEYMEIYKFRWIRDSVKGYKSANKYEIAYKILLENALITNETKERLNAIEVDSCS